MIEDVIKKGISWLGKLIVEELQEIEGKITMIRDEKQNQTAQLRRANNTLEKILAHCESVDGVIIQNEAHLEDIQASAFTGRNLLIELNNKAKDHGDDF